MAGHLLCLGKKLAIERQENVVSWQKLEPVDSIHLHMTPLHWASKFKHFGDGKFKMKVIKPRVNIKRR